MGTGTGSTAGAVLTLSAVGTTIKVLVDGVEKITGTAPGGAPTSGFPGLRSSSQSSGPSIYDDLSASVA